MTRSRALDWVLGALAMLVLLVLVVVLAFLVISDPASGSSPTARPTAVTVETSPVPPSDLGGNEIWVGGIDMQSNIVVLPDTSLLDVEIQGSGARSQQNGIVVDRLQLEGTVPFADVADEVGGDSRISAASDGQAEITRTVEVLGRQLSIVAAGNVTVRDGLLVVEPTSISVGGPDFLAGGTAALVRQLVTIEQTIEGLPPNLILRDVTVQSDGFRAELAGENVVLVNR